MKSHTDRKQSEVLREILPLDSADHCFLNDGTAVKANINSYNVAVSIWKDYYVEIIPSWSLSALLGLIPGVTLTRKDNTYYCLANSIPTLTGYSDPIDAVYEYIVKEKKV